MGLHLKCLENNSWASWTLVFKSRVSKGGQYRQKTMRLCWRLRSFRQPHLHHSLYFSFSPSVPTGPHQSGLFVICLPLSLPFFFPWSFLPSSLSSFLASISVYSMIAMWKVLCWPCRWRCEYGTWVPKKLHPGHPGSWKEQQLTQPEG